MPWYGLRCASNQMIYHLTEVLFAFAAGFLAEYLSVAVALIPFRKLNADAHWTERARRAWAARSLMEIGPFMFIYLLAIPGGLADDLEITAFAAFPFFLGAMLGALPGLRRVLGRRVTFPMLLAHYGVRYLLLSPAVAIFLLMLVLLQGRMLDAVSGAIMLMALALAVALNLGGAVPIARRLRLLAPPSPHLEEIVKVASQWAKVPPARCYILNWYSANAIALSFARALAFSAALLDLLTDEELLGVAAHEIAHLEESKSQKLTRLSGILVLFPIFSYPVWLNTFGATGIFVAFALVLVFGRILRNFSQRMEQRADAAAAHSEGANPQTYARALEKLYEGNLIPAVLRGKRLTHPHLYDRLLAAGTQPSYPRPQPPPRMAGFVSGMLLVLIPLGLLLLRAKVILPRLMP